MTQQMGMFDAVTAREAALERVTRENFIEAAIKAIRALPPSWEGTGEDVRIALDKAGVRPHHHNAWGALIMQAVRARVLVPTGRFTKMKTSKSHARMTRVYHR